MEEGITLYSESIRTEQHLLKNDASNTVLIAHLIGGLATLGNAFLSQKDVKSAIEAARAKQSRSSNTTKKSKAKGA